MAACADWNVEEIIPPPEKPRFPAFQAGATHNATKSYSFVKSKIIFVNGPQAPPADRPSFPKSPLVFRQSRPVQPQQQDFFQRIKHFGRGRPGWRNSSRTRLSDQDLQSSPCAAQNSIRYALADNTDWALSGHPQYSVDCPAAVGIVFLSECGLC